MAALAAALAGCGGATGTFSLELVTAPGSTVLDGVTHARLTLSQPFHQVEARRGADGRFHLSLDVPADGPSGQVTFEGFDDAGTVVAWGRSGVLPIAAIDASVAIYVAAPETLAAAAVALDPPRTEIGVTRFGFGVVLVGGAAAGDVPVDDVDIYDVYSHELVSGEAAPAARAGAMVGAGVTGYAYAFGGRGAGGPTGTFWRFDTTVTPAGAWFELADEPALARIAQGIAPVRADAFVVTGTPPVVLDGLSLSATALPSAPSFAGTATSVERDDAIYTVIAGDGTGASGLATLGPAGVQEHAGVAGAARTGHGAATTRDATVVVAGGSLAGTPTVDGLLADPAAATFTALPSLLATARTDAAIGGNGDVMILAGGRDASGTILADAEVIDLATLTRRTTIPMVVPRTGAVAASLATGQILILGGTDASGSPVGTIEIYTPAAPAPARPGG
jgi:hypothetical protein